MPPVRRGTVYRLLGGSPDLYGALVLSNDVWNRRMASVGAVPVRAPAGRSGPWEPSFSARLVLSARVGFLASLPTERFLEARFVLSDEQLRVVAAAMADLLALPELLASPPEAPEPVPGEVDHPRWGEIYYAGPPIQGQVKRFVVVSRDRWNARAPVPLSRYGRRANPRAGAPRSPRSRAAPLGPAAATQPLSHAPVSTRHAALDPLRSTSPIWSRWRVDSPTCLSCRSGERRAGRE